MRVPPPILLGLALASGTTAAADPGSEAMRAGKQAYETVCFGCHQYNGQGIPGAFPPLAGSPWVTGDPARMAKIVLHGLTGTITLDGHTYHAEMPPQGPLLDDATLAHVLTYVRNSWGNSAAAVDPGAVTALRAKYGDRTEYWDADALLKEHPLEDSGSKSAPHALTDLGYKLYKGDFKRISDIGKGTPIAQGSVAENRPSLSVRGDHKGGIGIEFDGKITTTQRGEYTFYLESDDGSQLTIDGKRIIDNDGIHAARTRKGKIVLSAGTFPLRLTYFDRGGDAKLGLGWESATFGLTALSEDQPAEIKPGSGQTMLAAEGSRARIYRNFIEGATARAIGVGYPGGINLAWDANGMRPALIWRGPFIDAGKHWTGRGKGFQRPGNTSAIALPPGPQFARLGSRDAPWPEKAVRESARLPAGDTRFRGYTLDSNGWPTFRYAIGKSQIADHYSPVLREGIPPEQQSTDTFRRTITLTGGATLTHRIASGDIEDLGERSYQIGEHYKITIAPGAGKPTLRKTRKTADLLIDATPGSPIETTLTLLP